MIKLHQNSLVLPTPGVVYKLWNYDHPTFEERVNFAKNYKPWEEGKPMKYRNILNSVKSSTVFMLSYNIKQLNVLSEISINT